MRSHLPNSGQESGPSEQKKSVFDRLGRQLDTGRSMNRRSPFSDHLPPPPPPMTESDFPGGRYARDQDLEWRYQNERRYMQFPRHQQAPPPPPLPPSSSSSMGGPHYPDMTMPDRQPQYYPPGPPMYHNNNPPGGPMGVQMGPGGPMGMHQRRLSPKYDRHGNLIRGPPMRMDHGPGMSPPRNFMPPGPLVHPGYDMPPMRPGGGAIYPHHRWQDPLDMCPPQSNLPGGLMPDDHFLEPNRYQSMLQQLPQQQIMNPELEELPNKHSFGPPRYTKWRERRDVITNLDRETAQSSSRTDSLKSSLQQMDNKIRKDNKNFMKPTGNQSANTSSNASGTNKKPVKREPNSDNSNGDTTSKSKQSNKTEPQDISDGEIVDDESSSDESEVVDVGKQKQPIDHLRQVDHRQRNAIAESQQQYYEANKRRRLHDREECSMDYETISDEELDDFMSEKKVSEDGKPLGDPNGKSSSEMELLNALGLDWANLVEMSKQSKKEAATTTTTSCSALRRFSLPNYLPTLGISSDLAGSEIYNLLLKICH